MSMPISAIPIKNHVSFLVRYRTRIGLLLFVLLLPALVLVEPHWSDNPYTHFTFDALGWALIALGVMGRLWCTLYIGGRKNLVLQRTGPYSLVRHPLYVCSLLIGLGLSALSENPLVLSIILLYFTVQYTVTIQYEESRLLELFGDDYVRYQHEVPCFWPRLRGFDPTPPDSVNLRPFSDEVRHSIVFLGFIPLMALISLLHTQQLLPFIHIP